MPGFVFFFPFLISALGNKDWQLTTMFTFFILFFPFAFIFYQFHGIFETCCKREVTQFYQTTVTRMTSAEAAIESTGQLILQLFTVMNGYPSDLIQIITICSSFFQIARSVILQDIEQKIWIKSEESLTFCQTLIETLKRIPIYVPVIIFRTGSLVVTMVYLRSYAIISISLLLIEIGYVSWTRFRKSQYRISALQYTSQITISNIGVPNSYAFAQCDISRDDEEDETVITFLIQSMLLTFFHHSIVLVLIMVIGYVQPPGFFSSDLVIKPGGKQFFIMVGSIIGVGMLGLGISLCRLYRSKIFDCFSSKTESLDQENRTELQEKVSLEPEKNSCNRCYNEILH